MPSWEHFGRLRNSCNGRGCCEDEARCCDDGVGNGLFDWTEGRLLTTQRPA